jgi:glycosyltransferase involved in cell wall biosynthesis
VTDALILKNILEEISLQDTHIIFLDKFDQKYKSDIGIWIQNYYGHLLENFKINIFYINEEWFDYNIEDLKRFDYVICKSNYAYNIIKNYCNAICLPFISKNLYNINVERTSSFLHFVGRSIQKNTELILTQTIPITLVDSYNRYIPPSNFNHINTYQSEESISYLLNSHNIHICCSLYESWGHYLFEGLSTGAEIICSDIPVFREQLDPDLVHFIPVEEFIDQNYIYCTDNTNNLYPFRKSFFVNKSKFKDVLENFKLIGKNKQRCNLFKSINDNNRRKMIYFFKNL